jgi:hypothetical protein
VDDIDSERKQERPLTQPLLITHLSYCLSNFMSLPFVVFYYLGPFLRTMNTKLARAVIAYVGAYQIERQHFKHKNVYRLVVCQTLLLGS